MKCDTVKELLPAVAGGDSGLERDESAQLQVHLVACVSCAARLESLRDTLSLLRRVGESEPLPRDFAASLHLRLSREPAPIPPLTARLFRWFERLHLDSAPRLGLAVAALAIVVVVVGQSMAPLGRGRDHDKTPPATPELAQEVAAAFSVPQQRIAVVRFDFVADVEVPDVEFEVTLPSELHFVDEGKILPERRLVWRGSLSSGSNPIPLAVRGVKPGRYRVTAKASGAGIAVRHDILLEVVRS
jgi:hypothetical protein